MIFIKLLIIILILIVTYLLFKNNNEHFLTRCKNKLVPDLQNEGEYRPWSLYEFDGVYDPAAYCNVWTHTYGWYGCDDSVTYTEGSGGMTAKQACCVCGGGDLEEIEQCEDIKVPNPSNPSELIDWHGSYNPPHEDCGYFFTAYHDGGFDCDDFDKSEDPRWDWLTEKKFGMTAKEACCGVCGGGKKIKITRPLHIFDIKERIEKNKISCDIEVYNYDSGISDKYNTADKIKYILDGTFSYTPNLVCISFKNEHIKTLHSKTFSYTPRLEQIDLTGNPIKLIGSEIFIDNIGITKKNFIDNEKPHRFVMDLPIIKNMSNRIMVVLYPETIIRLASENLLQKYGINFKFSEISYETLNMDNINIEINYFVNNYIPKLNPSQFKIILLVLLGVDNKLINNNKFKIGKFDETKSNNVKLCDCDNSDTMKCTDIISDAKNGFNEYSDFEFLNSFRIVYYKDVFYETDTAYWRCKYTDCSEYPQTQPVNVTNPVSSGNQTTAASSGNQTTQSIPMEDYNEHITKYSINCHDYKNDCYRYMSFIEIYEQILYLSRLLEYTQHNNTFQELPMEIKLITNESLLKDSIQASKQKLEDFLNSNSYIDTQIINLFARDEASICNSDKCKRFLPNYKQDGKKSKFNYLNLDNHASCDPYNLLYLKDKKAYCNDPNIIERCPVLCSEPKKVVNIIRNPPYDKIEPVCNIKNEPNSTTSAVENFTVENFTDENNCECLPYNIEYVINNKRISSNIVLSEVDINPEKFYLFYNYDEIKRFKILNNSLRVHEPIEPSKEKQNFIDFANLYFNIPSQLLSINNKKPKLTKLNESDDIYQIYREKRDTNDLLYKTLFIGFSEVDFETYPFFNVKNLFMYKNIFNKTNYTSDLKAYKNTNVNYYEYTMNNFNIYVLNLKKTESKITQEEREMLSYNDNLLNNDYLIIIENDTNGIFLAFDYNLDRNIDFIDESFEKLDITLNTLSIGESFGHNENFHFFKIPYKLEYKIDQNDFN